MMYGIAGIITPGYVTLFFTPFFFKTNNPFSTPH